MKGLRVTTIRHKCESYVSMFPPGAPVLIETYSYEDSDPDDGSLSFRQFPGFVVSWKRGERAYCYIKPGTPSVRGNVAFEPKPPNSGWVKLSIRRLTLIPGAPLTDMIPCKECSALPATINGVCQAINSWHKSRCKHVDHFKFLGGEIALHGSEWAGTERDDIPF